jgi:AmmeMemoRadiSam system protein B
MKPLMSDHRQPAVAGQFYPGSREGLRETVKSLIGPGPAGEAFGVMVPHAGYVYSGRVAGEVFGSVIMPDLFVILGPNHTGLGPVASIMTGGVWRLPMGDALVDEQLADSILSKSRSLHADETAHSFEHSIEVQLPFLQYLKGDVSFVPIALMTHSPEHCRDIGRAVAAAIREEKRNVLVVASSDMTHYESQSAARQKDQLALKRVLAIDPDGLLETVMANDISMCGVAPTAVMLNACRELGATGARLVKYATSGDVNGDYSQVVGYAGVVVT